MDVSVIVPVWNENLDRLQQTIDSAVQSLMSARLEFEVLVIDDGSEVPLKLAPFPVVDVHRITHSGIPFALNHGHSLSSGRRICVVSSGDGWSRCKAQKQWALMDDGVVATVHAYTDGEGREVYARPNWRKKLYTDNQFCLSTMMIDSDVWSDVGGFDESLTWCSDWDFSAKVHEHCGWEYIPWVMGYAAEHPGGHTDRAMSDPELLAVRNGCRATVAGRYSKQARLRRQP